MQVLKIRYLLPSEWSDQSIANVFMQMHIGLLGSFYTWVSAPSKVNIMTLVENMQEAWLKKHVIIKLMLIMCINYVHLTFALSSTPGTQ